MQSSRTRSRRRSSHSRSPPPRPRVIDHRRSPPWRARERSPPRRPVPGPERRDVMPFTPRLAAPPDAKEDMTIEERDERTIFVQQLARDTRPRDLEEFFSAVGHVRDVRVITDSKTRRSKGIAYVEFWDREAIPLALGLNGQRLLNAPLIITTTQAHMNREANKGIGGAIGFAPLPTSGPLKLCVSNLHPSINEEMLGAIFDPFGKIDKVIIPMDETHGVNKGYGYVIYRHPDEGKKAMEQLNGFELAGKAMRVISVEEEQPQQSNANGRQQLINQAKGAQLQQQTQNAKAQGSNLPPIATQCFMLSNMFDPTAETEEGWDLDVRDDVIDECNEHGGLVHIYVDKASAQGNVYVKCPSVDVAHKCVNALHGRWFAGKVIAANYVPIPSYNELFPGSMNAVTLLKSRPRQ